MALAVYAAGQCGRSFVSASVLVDPHGHERSLALGTPQALKTLLLADGRQRRADVVAASAFAFGNARMPFFDGAEVRHQRPDFGSRRLDRDFLFHLLAGWTMGGGGQWQHTAQRERETTQHAKLLG
jgi:hypothetical protein